MSCSVHFTEDYFGQIWQVHDVKISNSGLRVQFGWPAGAATGRGGCGAPRIVLTEELASYLASRRYRPDTIDLPIGDSSVRRLLDRLGFNPKNDRELWWIEHHAELAASSAEEFAARHGMALSKVQQARARRLTIPEPAPVADSLVEGSTEIRCI